MRIFLLYIFAITFTFSKAQDFIGPNGFNENFITIGSTNGDNGYTTSWYGKQDVGTDSSNVCYGNSECIFTGTTRIRNGNGDLGLVVNTISYSWENHVGFNLGNDSNNFVDISYGNLKNTVEISLENNSSQLVNILPSFYSNAYAGDSNSKIINCDSTHFAMFLTLPPFESKTFTIDLLKMKTVQYTMDEATCINVYNGLWNGAGCVYDSGFDITKLSGMSMSIVGMEDPNNGYAPIALNNASLTIHYIKGGDIPCIAPPQPINTTVLDSINPCLSTAKTLSAAGIGILKWYSLDGKHLGSGDTLIPDEKFKIVNVTDSNACGVSQPTSIAIKGGPIAYFFADPTEVCDGNTVTLINNSYNSIESEWHNPWGLTYSFENITDTAIGTWKLIVTDLNNCKDSMSYNINKLPKPFVKLTLPDTLILNNIQLPTTGGTPIGGYYSILNTKTKTLDSLINHGGYTTVVYSYFNSYGCGAADTVTTFVKIKSIIDSGDLLNALIKLGADLNNDKAIDSDEAMAITNLILSNLNLTDLSVIKYFSNLQTLDISNNQITSLDVSSLSNLISLICSNNQLTNIIFGDSTSLKTSGHPNLSILDCSNNKLTSLDLRDLTALTKMNCLGNASLAMICVSDANVAQSNINFIKDNTSTYSETCTVGIEKINNNPISIFPNPASQEINILGSFQSLSIVNAVGQTILTNSNNKIDVSFLQSGLYFLNVVNTDKTNFITKLIIE